MKKIEYMSPEMEILEFEVQNPLLDISGNGEGSEPGNGGDLTPIGGEL